MGAWQDSLRDALGISMGDVSTIGAATFLGSIVASLGGLVFDRLGPRASVALGGIVCTAGYLMIILAVVLGDAAPSALKMVLAAVGSACTGYSSVSLLDNVVCMACSLSFPSDRAAVVGYLKAVLATAAGLWALLWIHIFREPGPGLVAYLGFTAAVSLAGTMLATTAMQVLPEGPARRKFLRPDKWRLAAVIVATVVLSLFDVAVSFFYSRGAIQPTPAMGYIGAGLCAMPLAVLLFPAPVDSGEEKEGARGGTAGTGAASPGGAADDGIRFVTAAKGLDFWLLWFSQFSVFGMGVATNQNLGLILESAGNKEAAGLGVAIFALASSVSRMVVGVLSDEYKHVLSRFNWLQIVAICAVIGQVLLATMAFAGIMAGVFMAGLAFGVFFTVIVPVINEMYGRRQFGVIMGSQLACQAVASLSICKVLLPTVYNHATSDSDVCLGATCFRASFIALAGLNAVGVCAAFLLERRNRTSMPLHRLK